MRSSIKHIRMRMEMEPDRFHAMSWFYSCVSHALLEDLKYAVYKAVNNPSVKFEDEIQKILLQYDFGEEGEELLDGGRDTFYTFNEVKKRFVANAVEGYKNKECGTPSDWASWLQSYYDGTPVGEEGKFPPDSQSSQ